MTSIADWANFYVIVGSSAGALIGLQFVVVTLIARTPAAGSQAEASAAFATPTVVHFGTVLLVSAILSAPWGGIAGPSACWGLLGIGGLVYEAMVTRLIRTQTQYAPELEDWLFHAVLPLVAYAMLVATAVAARRGLGGALLGTGAAALLLLFVGIHNAWDTVTYHVFRRAPRPAAKAAPEKGDG